MYLYNKLGEEWDTNEDFVKYVRGKIEEFCSSVNKKWKKSNRCISKFSIKNEMICQPTTSRGRPRKLFIDLIERSKRREIEH